ncbi:NAD(P)-dependent oxidoreductase [Jatrophihabitans sp. DSM 45814]
MENLGEVRTVAVLGTGIMGAGIVTSLLRADLAVRAWNRTPAKAERLVSAGAVFCHTPREAVSGADAIITMLYDADAVIDVVTEAADAIDDRAVWLQCATIGLAGIERVAALAADLGLKLLDAPVLGTKGPAEQGKLVLLLSGDPQLVPAVQTVLDAIGSKTVWAGDRVGQSSALKLACNAWVAAINAATAQSLALAAGLGIDPKLFLTAISGGPSDSQYAQLKAEQMLAGEFSPSFALDGVLKDLGLITAAAEEVGVDSTVLEALLSTYRKASQAGHGDEDMAAVYTAFSAR